MEHKKFDEHEVTTCRICAGIYFMRKQKAQINHKDIIDYRVEELLNEN